MNNCRVILLLLLIIAIQSCAIYRPSASRGIDNHDDPLITITSNPIGFYEQAMIKGQKINQAELLSALENVMYHTNLQPSHEEWTKSIAAAESLYSLGHLGNETLQDLYRSYGRYIADASSPGVALAMLKTIIEVPLLSDDDLIFFFNLAMTHLSISPLTLLKQEMMLRSIDSQQADQLLKPQQDQSQWMKGTVMVHLEKGYKRQGPISIPQIELGSGFFIDRQGYILTNYHVIASMVDEQYKGPAKLSVQLWDSVGERLPAVVVGYSQVADLALIKVNHRAAYVFSFNLTDQAPIGQTVYALGSPGGFSFTLTKGLISNASRQLMPIGDVIQIDAAVNPGNSGGPLVNEQGEVIGVVFAGIPQFEGLNFALPSDMVRALLPKLADKGKAKIPFIYLSLYDWTDSTEITFTPTNQAISMLAIKVGDTLTEVGGHKITSRVMLQKMLLKYQSNSLIRLEWSHLGTIKSGIVVLKERPNHLGRYLLSQNIIEKFYAPLFGLTVTPASSRQYSVSKVYPGGIGSQHRFNVNDSFYFVRKERTSLGDELLAIRIQSTSRQLGALENGYGLLLYAPFENGSWL